VSGQHYRYDRRAPRVPLPHGRRYRHEGDVSRLLEGRYPFFFAHTDSCAKPMPSSRLGSSPCARGLCRLLPAPCWEQALPDVISANLSQSVWTLTPAASKVHVLVSSLGTLAFPTNEPGRRLANSPTATSVGKVISGLQSFANVQTLQFACHTGSSHPCTTYRAGQPWRLLSRLSRLVACPVQRLC
jgi:hypothetical protein